MTRDDTHKGIHATRQGLHIENRVGKPATAAVQSLGLGAVGVGVHHKARVVVRKVGVLPAHIHQSAVVHHSWVPVGILIEGHSAHRTRCGLVGNHITHLIAAVHTGHTLIADVRHRNDAAARHICSIEELKVGLFAVDYLMEIRAITIDLIDTPAVVLIGGCEEYPLAIPVKKKVGHAGAVRGLEDGAALHLATDVRQFGNLGIETAARRRALI